MERLFSGSSGIVVGFSLLSVGLRDATATGCYAPLVLLSGSLLVVAGVSRALGAELSLANPVKRTSSV